MSTSHSIARLFRFPKCFDQSCRVVVVLKPPGEIWPVILRIASSAASTLARFDNRISRHSSGIAGGDAGGIDPAAGHEL